MVFLTPLFFLPFSFEALEFNKQYLLFFLVSLGALAWLAKMVFLDKEVKFQRTPLDIPILAVVLAAVVSTIFSADKFSSLFGTYGRFSDGLIPLLSLAIFYFLIANNAVKISNLIKLFIYSGSIAVLFGYFSIFGIWAKINVFLKFLPQAMLQKNFNPVSGSMEGLAIFVSVFLALLVGILLTQKLDFKIKNLFYWLVLVAGLGQLVIIDFSAAWIVLLITLLALVVFSLANRIFRDNINKLLLPIFLLVIAGVFLFVNLPGGFQNQIPKEAVLSQSQSWSVSIKTAISAPKNVFLGSGPGTFSLDFSKFKSAELNKTNLWQYRFDRAGNNFAETLATKGLLGIVAYLALIVMFFMANLKSITSKLNTQVLKVQGSGINQLSSIFNPQLPLFLALAALLVGQFVFYQNAALSFAFWLILALSSVNLQKNYGELKYSFKESPETGLIFSVALTIVAVIFLGLYFFAARFYLADTAYLKAIMSGNEQVQIKNLEKAVTFSPRQSQYRIDLARFYFSQALNESDATTAKNFIANSINQIRIATEFSPNSVTAWEVRGLLYQEIINLAPGAVDWGIQSFGKAITLEPANPILHLELGKLLLATSTERAKKEFEKSIELYPLNPEALFDLGTINYNNNNLAEALSNFQKAVLLFPNYSNAHYALGLVYTAQSEKDLALAEFKKVLELNPGNSDVIGRINALEK